MTTKPIGSEPPVQSDTTSKLADHHTIGLPLEGRTYGLQVASDHGAVSSIKIQGLARLSATQMENKEKIQEGGGIRTVSYSVNINSLATKLGISFMQVLWHKAWGTLDALIQNKITMTVQQQIRDELVAVQNDPVKTEALLKELSSLSPGIKDQYEISTVINQFMKEHRATFQQQIKDKLIPVVTNPEAMAKILKEFSSLPLEIREHYEEAANQFVEDHRDSLIRPVLQRQALMEFSERLKETALIIGQDFSKAFGEVKDNPEELFKLLQKFDALPEEIRKQTGIVDLLRETAKGWNKEQTEVFNAFFSRNTQIEGGFSQAFSNIISARATLFKIQDKVQPRPTPPSGSLSLEHTPQELMGRYGEDISEMIGKEIMFRLEFRNPGSVFEYLGELERASPDPIKWGIIDVFRSSDVGKIPWGFLPARLNALKAAQPSTGSNYIVFETNLLSNFERRLKRDYS